MRTQRDNLVLTEVGRMAVQGFGFQQAQLNTSYDSDSEEVPKRQVLLLRKQADVLRVTLEWNAGEIRWAKIETSAACKATGELCADLLQARVPGIVIANTERL